METRGAIAVPFEKDRDEPDQGDEAALKVNLITGDLVKEDEQPLQG